MNSRIFRVLAPFLFLVVVGGALSLIGCSPLVRGHAVAAAPLETTTVPTVVILGTMDAGGLEGCEAGEAAAGFGGVSDGEPTYVVGQGESLASIARVLGVSAERLAEYNGLVLDVSLEAGSTLRIPAPEQSAPVDAANSGAASDAAGGRD